MADTRQQLTAHDDHGHSVAAWVTVCVLMLAALVMSVGVAVASTAAFVVGLVVAGLGLVAGKVLATMGYGAPGQDQGQGQGHH